MTDPARAGGLGSGGVLYACGRRRDTMPEATEAPRRHKQFERDEYVMVYVTKEEKAEIEEAAEQRELPMSPMIRSMVLEQIRDQM